MHKIILKYNLSDGAQKGEYVILKNDFVCCDVMPNQDLQLALVKELQADRDASIRLNTLVVMKFSRKLLKAAFPKLYRDVRDQYHLDRASGIKYIRRELKDSTEPYVLSLRTSSDLYDAMFPLRSLLL